MADEAGSGSQDNMPADSELERLRRENEELRKQVGPSGGVSLLRSAVSWVLIVLTCIFMLAALLTTWLHATTLNTTRFVQAVAPLAKEEAVARAISEVAVARLFEGLDLERRIKNEVSDLPEPFNSADDTAVSASRSLAESVATGIIRSGAFQTVWRGILATAHSEAVQGLRATGPVRLNEQGEVILDITDLLVKMKDGLSSAGLSFLDKLKIPEGLGQVVLYENEQLGNAKQAVNILDQLYWVLPWAAVALLMLAAWAAPRRRRVLIEIAIAVSFVLVALMIGLKAVEYHYISPIEDPTNRSAAMAVASHVRGALNRVDLGLLIACGLTFMAAVIAGPKAWSAKVHQTISVTAQKQKRGMKTGPVGDVTATYQWPLRVVGFSVAILLLLYLPWANAATVAVVCSGYFIYLAAIEALRA